MSAVLRSPVPVVSHAVDATAVEKLRLTALFLLAAASDGREMLPFVSSATGRVTHQSFPETALEILDYAEITELFLTVLRESPCPMVVELKKAMAARYAIQNAADIVEALQ